MLLCGTKKGKLLIYYLSSGILVSEIEGAHFLAINDIDVTEKRGGQSHQGDLIITGGQDAKVRVWILSELLSADNSQEDMNDDFQEGACQSQKGLYGEFSQHTGAVTQVKFSSGNPLMRSYSGSLDKTVQIYDLPTKTIIKTIQMQSPVLKCLIDLTEQFAYIACENQNIYREWLGRSTMSVNEQEQMVQKKFNQEISANQGE